MYATFFFIHYRALPLDVKTATNSCTLYHGDILYLMCSDILTTGFQVHISPSSGMTPLNSGMTPLNRSLNAHVSGCDKLLTDNVGVGVALSATTAAVTTDIAATASTAILITPPPFTTRITTTVAAIIKQIPNEPKKSAQAFAGFDQFILAKMAKSPEKYSNVCFKKI